MLASLWLTEDYICNFYQYLNQLNPTIEQVFSNAKAYRNEVIKLLYIIKGIMRGLVSNKCFNLFFDWFYPTYLQTVMEGTLNVFHQDDEVVHICIKVLCELVSNRFNRIRFDTWNINGLAVFKETAKYVT